VLLFLAPQDGAGASCVLISSPHMRSTLFLAMNTDHIYCNFFFNLRGGTLGTAATTGLLYESRMIGDGDCGEICGIKIGRGNRSTWRKPAPAPLCLP
jgi:hypothetical protein